MLTAKISELKAGLSAYLAKVRAGGSVLILDRNTPVARIVPLSAQRGLALTRATLPASHVRRRSKVRVAQAVDVEELLRIDRDAR